MLGLALLPACADIMEPQETFDDAPEADAPPTQATLPAVPPSAAALKLSEQADACRASLFMVTSNTLYRFTPAVRAAYLDYAKAKTRADLAATGKEVPEEFLGWIDRTPDMEGSVYSARANCANVVLMLYSLRLDLGQERFEKYRQLALAMAIVHAERGPQATLALRAPLTLIIPECPLKPVNTKEPGRALDTNDHIINFLNENGGSDAKGRRPLTAADVMASRTLQEAFNSYMASNGCNVSVNCGDRAIDPKRKSRVTGPHAKGVLSAFKLFKAAYIAKGLLPEKADPSPSPAAACLFLIRNAEIASSVKGNPKLPHCPLTAPWPVLTFLARDMRSLREQDETWQRYRNKGELRTYAEYAGDIAQQPDFLAARRLAPFPFAYNTVPMMLKDGGVCGTMATLATRTYKALGVPASTAGQPGHCALVYFAQDAKTGAYQCKGSQFMRAGPKDTSVLTPWMFGEKDERKKMVYHQSTAWAMNHGFDAYIDTMMAWHLFRLLPADERKAHGQELLESGLALNPYNFLLADAGVDAANTPEARSRFETSFAAALDSVTRPDCPKTGLYPDTVYGRLKKNRGK